MVIVVVDCFPSHTILLMDRDPWHDATTGSARVAWPLFDDRGDVMTAPDRAFRLDFSVLNAADTKQTLRVEVIIQLNVAGGVGVSGLLVDSVSQAAGGFL